VISGSAFLFAPVFEGGRLSAQVKRSRARAKELASAYRQSVLLALQDVADALAANAHSAELYRQLQQQEAVARHMLSLGEVQYKSGTIDLLALLELQRSYRRASDQRIQAELQALQASVSLYRALAGGYDTSLADARSGIQ